MGGIYTLFAAGMIVAVIMLWRSVGADSFRGLLVAMAFAAVCSLLLTPPATTVFGAIRPNTAHMLCDVCALGVASALLGWVRAVFVSTRPAERRLPVAVIHAGYGLGAVALVVLFAVAPAHPEGVGFTRDFAGDPAMQAFWIVFAGGFAYGLAYATVLFALAAVAETGLRRVCLTLVTVGCVLGTVYSAWKIVLVTVFAADTPHWAQRLSSVLIVAFVAPITLGVGVPPLVGSARAITVARADIRRLTPLHSWLMDRYPQLRYRKRVPVRPRVRATDMFVEIADGLRLLQRDAPETAIGLGIDDASITAEAGTAPTDYVQTAALRFTGEPAV